MARDFSKLAQAMCSIDLVDSHWTQELPRLPVPDLLLTASRYLASLKAVLCPQSSSSSRDDKQAAFVACGLSKEQVIKMRKQFERTDQIVRQFMLNQGPQLQRDLKEYANKCQNWATEYWLQDMYLSNALPLPVNSNPFFMFPRQTFNTSEEMLMFATRIIQFSIDFKYHIDQQTLKQDFGSGHGKGKPLCMETYKNFFHSYRMPHDDMDRLLPQSRRSNHIVVASCNQFYILRLGQDPLDNPYTKDSSLLMNETTIFDQLLRIYRSSREHAKRELLQFNNEQKTPKVGLFTTENRKIWAKLHKKLNHCQPTGSSSSSSNTQVTESDNNLVQTQCTPINANIESLKMIEDCLFVMCLDSLVNPTPFASMSANSPVDHKHDKKSSPDQIKQDQHDNNNDDGDGDDDETIFAAKVILTGGGTHLFTANRWFDKFLQIIVGRDGICGINIEHSASEGITVLRFLEDFLKFIHHNPILKRPPTTDINNNNSIMSEATIVESLTSPAYVEPKSPRTLLQESDKITPLMWNLNEELLKSIDEAECKVNKLIDDFSLYVLRFNTFGRKFIKSQNLSPDAFIQLALQYTFYKLHGFLVSTYESASLRQFRLGRVDNIRANTSEAFEWIQAMLLCKQNHDQVEDKDCGSSWQTAESAFIKAITKQVEILRYTIVGGAPDNHLLALKQLAHIRYDDELPDIFTDLSYREFLNFRLSTSQLPNESGILVGYGAVTQDGYGCSYNPCQDCIIFCISSFKNCLLTNSTKFGTVLRESLLEMQQLCLSMVAPSGAKK